MSFTRSPLSLTAAALLAVAGIGGVVMAQGGDSSSSAPSDGNSFEISGVMVDVRGANADAARQGGWRLAQRKGWDMLAKKLTGHGSTLGDGALDAMVTGIVVEQEQIGPTRYIARLGVLFDRGKAGAILGVSGQINRSPPMLLVPVEYSGGSGITFERETAWKQAWDRFRSGNSSIDYVRPRGTGPDAMLLNAGQIARRGRNWWRQVLDQYGASDVLVAEVQLRRDYPGGPVTAIFAASHGPDKVPVANFALRVDSADAIDALMDAGIQRIDQAYQDALSAGVLKTDALLAVRPPVAKTAEQKAAEAAAAAAAAAAETNAATPTPEPVDTSASYTVQVETPSAASVTASEASVRGIPGVRTAATTSLALGGISVMRVTYDGPIASLRSALEARGWSVQEGPGVLRIRRAGGGGTAPAPTGDNGGG